jgi:hypothetical protein
MAVQVDPIKPTLKAPGTRRLTLNCDELLSSSAFKINLRRYNVAAVEASAVHAAAEREERLQAGARANHARCVIVIDTLFQASFLELNGSL